MGCNPGRMSYLFEICFINKSSYYFRKLDPDTQFFISQKGMDDLEGRNMCYGCLYVFPCQLMFVQSYSPCEEEDDQIPFEVWTSNNYEEGQDHIPKRYP